MLSSLQPSSLWKHFSELNAIPRPSKKEERVIEFMLQFGSQLGLSTQRDKVGNVIIKKPATKGMEKMAVVCLQSHLDMVHQKNAETQFDFNAQGINMLVDGDWVKASGTTLGADNGIGVAAIMAVLAATDITHPAIEALFTIDEETGMTGALNLEGGLLQAQYLLNLDTEDDRELTIGCAGGVDVTAANRYATQGVQADVKAFCITLRGLTGGHSGMDIYLGRANANKLMNRVLLQAEEKFSITIHSIDGGSLRNAIPRESVAVVCVPAAKEKEFNEFVKTLEQVLRLEYATTDPNLSLGAEPAGMPATVLDAAFQRQLLRALYACPNGIYRMSPDIDRLVQSSNNLARVLVKEGEYSLQCLTRSSVDSEKMDLAAAIKSTFELAGANVSYAGAYPGWTPKPGSDIVKLMSRIYKELFKEEAHVNAVHAGLECGILGTNYPGMQMISFGPNIRGAHSPDEKVQISSVQKFWTYLLETLKQIPQSH